MQAPTSAICFNLWMTGLETEEIIRNHRAVLGDVGA